MRAALRVLWDASYIVGAGLSRGLLIVFVVTLVMCR